MISIVETPTPDILEETSKPPLKISTVSQNIELNHIMSELKLYQRDSYYTKDFNGTFIIF